MIDRERYREENENKKDLSQGLTLSQLDFHKSHKSKIQIVKEFKGQYNGRI